MTDVSYRPAAESDIPVAQEMRAAMIRELNDEDPDDTHPGWRERYQQFYSEQMAGGDAALFLAEAAGQPVGVAAVYLLRNHRSGIFGYQSAYVSNVWVRPEHRRKGIASELTRMAVAWSRAKGCEVVRLRSSQMGRPVYAALGFRPSDEMELRLD